MSFTKHLLKWFDQFGRHDLPWQQDPTPYKIWLSEIMLQQTQVSTVIPYYRRFLDHCSDIKALASTPLDKVLALWAGLGYYARARNLHKTAKLIMKQHRGILPTDFDSLVALPGIGRSTAGAILAFTTQQRYPILDGNVRRVLSRYFAVKGVVSTRTVQDNLWALSDACTPKKRVHHYTQAIMDMGATLCTRTKPKCTLCPVASSCQALQANAVHAYPERAAKAQKPVRSTQMLLLVNTKQKKILLEKRPMEGIWGGMWSLPECATLTNPRQWVQSHIATHIKKIEAWTPFRHTFTHYHLDIHARLIEVTPKSDPSIKSPSQWFDYDKALQLGLPAPVKRLLTTLTDIQ